MAHYTHRASARLDWILIGIPLDRGGVMVVASDTLSKMSMEGMMTTTTVQAFASALFEKFPRDMVYELNTSFSNVVFARGDTYADAVLKLFRTWSPREPEQFELEPQRELPTQTSG